MLSNLYFIFAGQRGFEVNFFHPANDLYPYQKMEKELLAGLKVQGEGQAGPPDEFERVVRKTWTDIQAKKEQTVPKLKRLIDDLKSRDVLVRLKAAKSLGKLGPKAKNAVPVLSEVAQKDVDEDVRKVASRALENIKVGSAAVFSEAAIDRQAVRKERTEGIATRDKTDESPTITDQTPDGSKVTITPNAQSRRLAQEIGVIAREKYNALDLGIIGYEARFQILKNGAALGELICIRDPKTGRTTARLNTRENRDSAVWIEQLFEKAFFSILEPTPKGGREYACRSGDSYIMADYDAVSEDIQASMVFFENDFRVARRVKIYSNGQVQELQIRWQRDRLRLEISFSGSLEPKFQTWLKNSAEFGFRSTVLSISPIPIEDSTYFSNPVRPSH
ncbi:MAG: HEAT repeat domain-containing protein [bacterium]|nr:HEAT repeat domain-containing protein [bacterium]